MTLSCLDCETIPKVEGAGRVSDSESGRVQLMHNGLRVVHGGYYGDWMAEIIEGLRGHHEPQEEFVFDAVLRRIDGPAPAMVELGCFWAYYSLWFLSSFADGVAIAVEPDPDHLAIGRRNAELNGLAPRFHRAAAGSESGAELELPSELHPGTIHRAPIMTVDDLMTSHDLDRLDLLHMDIQGHELQALQATEAHVRSGTIRFVIVSTHHHYISGDALTHQRCLEWLVEVGAHIIAEHTVAESFSGDGLIAASFDDRDRDFTIDLSRNRASTSLFESPEHDLDRIMRVYDDLRSGAV